MSQIFQLHDDHGTVVDVQLLSVDAGVSLTQDYTCYAAVFRLPPGMAATQGTYRVSHASAAWSLFLAPIRPDASGSARGASGGGQGNATIWSTALNTPVMLNPTQVGTAGGSQPFAIRNRFLGTNFIIALQGVFPSRS